MAKKPTGSNGGKRDWQPNPHALHLEKWVDPEDTAPTSIVVSHPTAPYLGSVKADGGEPDEAGLQTIACDYLDKLLKLKKFGTEDTAFLKTWVKMLDPKRAVEEDVTFAWAPVATKSGIKGDPLRTSVRANRASKLGRQELTERTVVLIATQTFPAPLEKGKPKTPVFLGSEFGIRIVLHLVPDKDKTVTVYDARITGMSVSLPFGPYREFDTGELFTAGERIVNSSDGLDETLNDLLTGISKRLQLQKDEIYIHGLRLGTKGHLQVEARGTGKGIAARRGNPHFGFVVLGLEEKDRVKVYRIEKFPLTANAAPARVFKQDPQAQSLLADVSEADYRERRPTRSKATQSQATKFILDMFREKEEGFPNPLDPDLPECGDFVIVYCPDFVREDRDETGCPKVGAKVVELDGVNFPDVRSNDFSAVSAYFLVKQMFGRMTQYGFDTAQYFRAAERPIQVHYRSGIAPGPGRDGKTVNARVQAGSERGYKIKDAFGFLDPDKDTDENFNYNAPAIAMHLALGNLSHRARKPWDGTKEGVAASAAQPLGIAADERWLWHEFGHVLLMANFGELEMRFVHSPGDALAAIACDPDSRLAATDARFPERRGLTYPWVFIPRRHDRNVMKGWSWAADRSISPTPTINPRKLAGYRAEQILSSTLFRMYRCLGGDTLEAGKDAPVADVTAREGASHYSLYLIMRGLQLLALPPYHGECLADALMQADVGTTTPFKVSGMSSERVGGCAHKVIRWAFEAQGMYGPGCDPMWNRPGLPPAVDIFIADRRPVTEPVEGGQVTHRPGGYVPVSLDWGGLDCSDGIPRWHAHVGAISIKEDGIYVTVGNRGSEEARKVTVRVLWAERPKKLSELKWNAENTWEVCAGKSVKAKNIKPGKEAKFGPFAPPKESKYVIFAEATCDDDRASSDLEAHLPCGTQPTLLAPLVAGDNNIGLRIVETK